MMTLQQQRIMVTGGAGFLGRYVVEALRARGASPLVVRSQAYDLRDPARVRALLDTHAPSLVIHLAATVGGIGANRLHPGQYLYENALMGLHLIHEAMRAGVSKVVTVGSICSYPKHAPTPFREDSLWDGYPEETNAPYGIAKKLLLVQSQAYRQEYGLNAVYLMPTNLYGPGDNFDPRTSHVIPALIRKCLEATEQGAREIVAWGTGRPTREFLYVADAAEAIVRAADAYDDPAPMNIGSGQEISIQALTKLVARLCGFTGRIRWDARQPDGQPRRLLDTSRARDALGWTATTSLMTGLATTIDWYRRARTAEKIDVAIQQALSAPIVGDAA